MSVKQELTELFADNEKTTVGEIIEWARKHSASALYHELKFNDNATAAELWRQHHVRKLIAIHIVDPGGQRQTVSLSIDRVTGGGYRAMNDVLREMPLREVLLEDAFNELHRVEAKFDSLNELARVWDAVHEAERAAERKKKRSRPTEQRPHV